LTNIIFHIIYLFLSLCALYYTILDYTKNINACSSVDELKIS